LPTILGIAQLCPCGQRQTRLDFGKIAIAIAYDADMRHVCPAWGLVLALGAAACGGSSGDSGNAGASLTCAPKQLRVQGSIDGMPIDINEMATGYAFVNKLGDSPGSLDAPLTNGELKIEFDTLTPFGGKSSARGFIKDGGASLSVGNCETGPFSSTMSISSDGNTMSFSLTQLVWEPYCGGQAATGDLSGCFGMGH